MVHIFRCHRFVSQRVVSTNNEPDVICTNGDRLFVASSNSYSIEEYLMKKEEECKKIRNFSSVGRIIQMKFSKTGDFLATIEEDIIKSATLMNSLSLRVYTNLQAASSNRPMKMRMSGQVTRAKARHQISPKGSDQDEQLIVIEIPLKKPPLCISTYGQNIAIGIGSSVYVYGLSDRNCRDIRCILEIEFVFKVRRIDICEEFIMCSSGSSECQVVQLCFDQPAESLLDSSRDKTRPHCVRSFYEHKALAYTAEHCSSKINDNQQSTKPGSPHETGIEINNAVEMHQKCQIKQRPLVERQIPVASSCHSNLHLKKPDSKSQLTETAGGGMELLGPLEGVHNCQVSVEFEGEIRKNSFKRSGILRNGVLTLLYKKLDYGSVPIHTIQLLPIFLDEVNLSSYANNDNRFLSEKRNRLVGLFCIVSTATYSFTYSLLNGSKLISFFHYANNTTQVILSESHLFALCESQLDIYTSRCLSHLVSDAEADNIDDGVQRSMPFVNQEPSLIGYHKFFNIKSICQTEDFVTLLSKYISQPQSSDISWSIYVLQRPEIANLYNEMMDHADENSNTSFRLCITQEAYMLLRSYIYLRKWTENKELITLLKRAFLFLANLYEKHETDSHLALTYHLMAEETMDGCKNVQSVKKAPNIEDVAKLENSCSSSSIASSSNGSGIASSSESDFIANIITTAIRPNLTEVDVAVRQRPLQLQRVLVSQ